MWDAQTGLAISPFVAEPNGDAQAHFSHDGRRVVQWSSATTSGQHSARVWEVSTGSILATLAPHWQSVRNRAIARRRAMIEQVFGTMKRGFGFARARYTDFKTNVADAFRFSTVFNLRRAASLLAA